MSLFCALCNEIPQNPVVSPVSGSIFEKRLILKYLEEQGDVDPINGEKLTKEMLIDIKTNPIVQPRPPSGSSIPGLLKCLQDEWDSLMLNNFNTRQQLQVSRQELSHSLYQHDACCRVISRLIKEITESREALGSLKPRVTNTQQYLESLLQPIGMSEDILEYLQKNSYMLTAERKKKSKTKAVGVAGPDDVQEYKLLSSHSGIHSAATPGILCLDVSHNDEGKYVVTGGNDGNVVLFDREKELILKTLKGHSKKVTNVLFHPVGEMVISSSADSTIRLWNNNDNTKDCILHVHSNPVTDISLDPTGRYLLSGSTDGNWCMSDIYTNNLITRVPEEDAYKSISCSKFHPDGLYFGLGSSSSTVRIWDIRGPTSVASFSGHSGMVTSMSFSENGYYLASSAQDGKVIIWDLRKSKDIHTINLGDNYEIKTLAFDKSGGCLAVGGNDIKVYRSKQWDLVNSFQENTALITNVKFSENNVMSSSLDRHLRCYGKAS